MKYLLVLTSKKVYTDFAFVYRIYTHYQQLVALQITSRAISLRSVGTLSR